MSPPKVAEPSASPLDPKVVRRLLDEGAQDDMAPGRLIRGARPAEHRNHTPFPSQYFQTVDQHGEVFHVVALRATYDMQSLQSDGTLACARQQSPLATADAWSGLPNQSCPLWESDFAPYKPRCDVLLANAVSRPPAGPARRWPCGVAPQWLDDEQAPQQWVKRITVLGPRRYRRLGLGLDEPRPISEVPVSWLQAFGGEIKEPAADVLHADGTVKKAAGSDRWETDHRNPVGVGLNRKAGSPAPQLQASVERAVDAPVSLTPLGRAWLPRRRLAGTYDNAWLERQWPLPPLDMDWAYWNCAPADQQLPYLPPGARVHLLNLHPPGGAPLPVGDDGVWRGKLPADELFLLWRLRAGPMLVRPLNLDTLVVDLATRQIHATYRGLLSAQAQVRVVEARRELAPGAAAATAAAAAADDNGAG